MKISDLAGLSEPLTRLIEVISKGIGCVFAPNLIKRTADAKAYEIKAIAGALKEVKGLSGLPVIYDAGEIEVWQKPEDGTLSLAPTSSDERTSHRLEYQERKRQHNIESVTAEAAANLAAEKQVAKESPDEDWINRFFTTAQDVSSEEMQILWGRILAGEIKHPGSYSLRTLDFVRNLNKRDAAVFEKVAKLALSTVSGIAFVVISDAKWLETDRNIYQSDHFLLSELGLMYPTNLSISSFIEASTEEVVLFGKDHLVLIKRGGLKGPINLPIWKFTDVGKELIPLIERPMDEAFLEKVAGFFTSRKCNALIGEITARLPDGRASYRTIREIKEPEQEGRADPPKPDGGP